MKVKLYVVLLSIVTGILSGCELTRPNQQVVPVSDAQQPELGEFDPAAYYLNLETLNEDQIFNELELLLLDPQQGNNGIKLGLIYAYKKSPVKNPHRAHALFNKALASDQAFIQRGMLVALNDQIADSLRWLHKYEDLASTQQQQEDLLQQQIGALKMQLDELTRIEQQLNERN
ncbi:hypothetical protein SNR37_001598 [Agarivorans aestuarii]|uniref:Uncharacterized protein n=1 Tax=Agarivorans aestuarii TaxID=1563703 RepID=A0ABU7GA30_9ALTE|nr:hypothetical protein [Agarivorans aestuarii]MEE1676266.1 hypothetical protein [Agarivorans aestuarii]